jgi:hypothetical protein
MSLKVVSRDAYKAGSYNTVITFPDTVNVASSMSTMSGFSCQRNSRIIENQWICIASATTSFPIDFRLVAAVSADPSLRVAVGSEQCVRAEKACFNPAVPKQEPTPNKPNNTINLGALGDVEHAVFWPIVVGVSVVIIGFGVVLYKRRARNSNDVTEDEERRMASSQNRSGWFGEKKPKTPVKREPIDGSGSSTADASKEKSGRTRSSSNSDKSKTTRKTSTGKSSQKAKITPASSAADLTDLETARAEARAQRMRQSKVHKGDE